ncbi:TIGR01459 family HAD-type hydrolase [Rhizobium sp. TRM95796]|uniref:TIGR01459 family HAD-type hydrolase n=1 Tax=Rhizobium sp. TRM95796 TaxID=2979862 RepID=UPI0021E81CDE|nr:TIGR01459 family HAD-type hydrolase [Rhizobium sp. TRM95796]MCV3765946.1 TIGR01459 family HAD-type hydrolase [Rhizobium sp. TRM95796]
MTLAVSVGLHQLALRYDTFFIDQFGVLRDDRSAYPGANEALLYLKSLGKTVIILSNSGRSGVYNAQRFEGMGFDRAGFDHFVTSGDVAYDVLKRENGASAAPKNCLTISSGGDRNLSDRLGYIAVADAAHADLVIVSGSDAEIVPLDVYRDMLRPAAMRNVACYCTNPDRHKLANGATAPGAGSIAGLYEELGGEVRWFGKPHPDIYEHALSLAGRPRSGDVVCIGDSLEHDIAGAKSVGLASCLVRTGILSGASAKDLESLAARYGATPDFVMTEFKKG